MGHFGILELALFNIDQDPKDSNVHPCYSITYFYHFLQCLVLVPYEKKNPTIYFSFGTKYANMGKSKQRET